MFTNNYNYGATPMRPQYPSYMPPTTLKGHMVTGIEEARAAQIDLDGSITYFPSPAENRIYAKTIDMNGMPIFMVYQYTPQTQTPHVDNNSILSLTQRVEKLEAMMNGGGMNVEPNATNAVNGTAPAI